MIPTLSALLLCLSPVPYDGDSIRCADGLRVRLWGVSAVELRDPGGREAREALSRVLSGRDLICQVKGASFNRVVAQCWAISEDVGGEMVRKGQAKDDERFSGGYYAEGVQ